MKGKTAFRVICFGVGGLTIASFLLHVAWQIKSGHGGETYYNYKLQPLTYWGFAGTLAVAVLAGTVGLLFRLREILERQKYAKWQKAQQALAADRPKTGSG
jgi:hypothetical protein